MKQITHGTTHNKKGHTKKKNLKKLLIWPITSPILAYNPWDSLKSLIEKSNSTFPRFKRHYHIAAPKHTEQMSNLTPNRQTHFQIEPLTQNLTNPRANRTQTKKLTSYFAYITPHH